MSDDTSNGKAPKGQYRCPPSETRFQKGQSGNPRGRPPKQARSYTRRQSVRDVMNVTEQMITVNTPSGAKDVSVIEAVLMRIALRALNDHGPSQRLILNLHREALDSIHEANPKKMENLDWLEDEFLKITDIPKELHHRNIKHMNKRRKETWLI